MRTLLLSTLNSLRFVKPSFFQVIVLVTAIAITSSWAEHRHGGGQQTVGFDGPAQLPLVTVASSMADTPAPGSVITVNANQNFQTALNSAQCGDTIQLQAGAVFTGPFEFPALDCDDAHWIIVRTSTPDAGLPAEGTRVTPCYAGVATLVGRPQYPCGGKPQNVLTKLTVASGGDGPVRFQAGANHYRLVGLELTRPICIKGAFTLMATDRGVSASYIVLDRSWLHGTVKDDTKDGFAMAGINNAAVVDSYFSDFHCTSRTGACTDAHAVSGGTGNNQDGPYEIRDNFLEASGEAVMFGGGAATTTPADITIHYNHFFKPWQWKKGKDHYQGGQSGKPFVVKNHLELKNAVRVLAEANIMEDVWGGFSQTGFAILLTPKNQHTKRRGNVCPICEVTDVTLRYMHIIHAGGGIVLATIMSGNGGDGGPAAAGTRFSIHDLVIDDIEKKDTGFGRLFLIANSWSENPINTITVNHITGFPDPDGGVLITGNKKPNPAMWGFTVTNSIMTSGRYPIWNEGGGNASCAISDSPLTILNTCFTSYSFDDNLVVAAPVQFPPSAWPTTALFISDPNNVGFVDYNNGNGGNYELESGSPYKNMGTDGKDLGADIVGLNTFLANVE